MAKELKFETNTKVPLLYMYCRNKQKLQIAIFCPQKQKYPYCLSIAGTTKQNADRNICCTFSTFSGQFGSLLQFPFMPNTSLSHADSDFSEDLAG